MIERSFLLSYQGVPEEGIRLALRAIELNPLHPDLYWAALASGHLYNRNFSEAVRVYRLITIGYPESRATFAAALALTGNEEEARAEMSRFLAEAPQHWSERRTIGAMLKPYSIKRPEDADLLASAFRLAGAPD